MHGLLDRVRRVSSQAAMICWVSDPLGGAVRSDGQPKLLYRLLTSLVKVQVQ